MNKRSESNLANQKNKYWMVSIDYKEPLVDFMKQVVEDLRVLFKDKDSYLNMVSFPKNSNKSFVSNAKVGDFVLQISKQFGDVKVAPFRQIIKKEDFGSSVYFYIEATQESKKQIITYEEFLRRLKENGIKLIVTEDSIKKIPDKYIAQINIIW